MLIESKDVYTLHKFGVGKTLPKFHATLKPNVELKRQRASKVPLHLKGKLEKLITQLKDAKIIREMGDHDEMGSLFVNPIILMPKNDDVELVIDARYLNSVTNLTNYSWPLEPVQMIMTRVIRHVLGIPSSSSELRNTEIDKLHHWWTTIYFHARILRSVCSTNSFTRLIMIHSTH